MKETFIYPLLVAMLLALGGLAYAKPKEYLKLSWVIVKAGLLAEIAVLTIFFAYKIGYANGHLSEEYNSVDFPLEYVSVFTICMLAVLVMQKIPDILGKENNIDTPSNHGDRD